MIEMISWLIRSIICMPLLFVFALIVKCQLIEPYSFVQIDFEIHDVEPVAKKGDREI